ncbi:MAG: ABC transporter permease [Candidatus Binatia bacterium]
MNVRSDSLTDVKIIVRPSHGWSPLRLGSLWEYRDLLLFLVRRDVKVRYRQTFLGILWAILQPGLMTIVFFVFFGQLAGVPSDGIPYPVFVFCGLLPWQLFASALSESSNSLVANEKLITKVFFPRLIIPVSAALVGLVDFFFGFLVLLGVMIYWGISLAWTVWMLPFFLFLALAAALSAGIWLAALNVQYRDVRYAIPFIIQLWFFLSPIVYPSSMLPERWRWLYSVNPMSGVIEGMRWALLGHSGYLDIKLAVSIIAMAVLLVSGLYYFRRVERHFADVI